jgi:hypothetical protein
MPTLLHVLFTITPLTDPPIDLCRSREPNAARTSRQCRRVQMKIVALPEFDHRVRPLERLARARMLL